MIMYSYVKNVGISCLFIITHYLKIVGIQKRKEKKKFLPNYMIVHGSLFKGFPSSVVIRGNLHVRRPCT